MFKHLCNGNWLRTSTIKLLYSGKLLREKTFTNFAVLEPPAKVFSSKFGRAVLTYVRF